MIKNRDLKRRILEISKKHGLSHIGSCLSCLPILEDIYRFGTETKLVVLDNAHAHLAHLVVRDLPTAEEKITKYGIHCDRRAGCDASGGSLGHGLGISIGLALATPYKMVYCIVSDGSMMEGSNWEALRLIKRLDIKNIEIHCNFNGYTAVARSQPTDLASKIYEFIDNVHIWETNNTKEFDGVEGHYKKL